MVAGGKGEVGGTGLGFLPAEPMVPIGLSPEILLEPHTES